MPFLPALPFGPKVLIIEVQVPVRQKKEVYNHTLGRPHSDTTPGFTSLEPHSEHTISSELFMCKYPAQEFRKSKQLEHCNLWVCLESSLRVVNPSQEGAKVLSSTV